jgi:hypothetical protein
VDGEVPLEIRRVRPGDRAGEKIEGVGCRRFPDFLSSPGKLNPLLDGTPMNRTPKPDRPDRLSGNGTSRPSDPCDRESHLNPQSLGNAESHRTRDLPRHCTLMEEERGIDP